ncbi:MAG: cupin domain-containing protein [Pseudomonadota bacterium]
MMIANLFEGIPAELPEELFTPLLTQGGVKLERIVSRGHVTPEGEWFDQEDGEWVAVLKGEARLEIEGREDVSLGPGDHLFLPAHRRHRVAWTDPDQETVWIALFVPSEASA